MTFRVWVGRLHNLRWTVLKMGNKSSRLISSIRQAKFKKDSLENTQRAGTKRPADEMSCEDSYREDDIEIDHSPERFATQLITIQLLLTREFQASFTASPRFKFRDLEAFEVFIAPFYVTKLKHSFYRKRLRTTSEYIYNVLFLEGENSDISIYALGT